MTLIFDRVVIVAQGGRRDLSVDCFLALPIHERVNLVLSRRVEFFDGFRSVDRRSALQSLRQREACAA